MAGYSRKLNMICFEKEELERLIELPSKLQILKEIAKRGYSLDEILKDFNGDQIKMHEIVESSDLINDKEDVEIFTATYALQDFYPKSKVCFYLKDGLTNPSINSLADLKSAIKENDITDLGILIGKDLINFQLKSYRREARVDTMLSFIKENLLHYANNIGTTNLLITMQLGGIIEGNFFQNIHSELKKLNLKGTGHILILYNEGNKTSVINTVYPILGTTRIPINLTSGKSTIN